MSGGRARAGLAPASSWLVYLGGCILLFLVVISLLQPDGVRSGKGGYYLIFGSYWASGKAAAQGLNPYAEYPLTFKYHLSASPLGFVDLNLNTPCLLPLFQALSHLTIGRFITVWMLGSLLLFISGTGILLWRYPEMRTGRFSGCSWQLRYSRLSEADTFTRFCSSSPHWRGYRFRMAIKYERPCLLDC